MFPDPVTEGVTFWKSIYSNSTDFHIKQLATNFGNPKILPYSNNHFPKLLEDPNSLNLPKGLSAPNLIKDEIKRALMDNPFQIKNEVIRDAVIYVKSAEERFVLFLTHVDTCFSRFLISDHLPSLA